MTVHDMRHVETIDVAAAPGAVYALVSDMPRMGEFSPENVGGRWGEGASGAVGDSYFGDNKIGDREWTVECKVTVADQGQAYEWITGGDADDGPYVRWRYDFAANSSGGTTVSETWDVETLPPTLRALSEDQLAGRKRQVQAAMAETLAAIKTKAEA